MFGLKNSTATKRAMVLLAMALVVLVGLVGCGLGKPKSAQDVLTRYVQAKDIDNFKGKATIDANMTVLGQKVLMALDSTFEVAVGSVHGTNSTTLFGQPLTSEVYWQKQEDGYMVYSSTGEGTDAVWAKTKLESKSTDTTDFANGLVVVDKLLKDTQFSESDDGYVLTVPGASLWDAISSSEEFKEAVKDIDTTAFEEGLKNSEVLLTFDKDCRLVGLSTNVEMTLSSSGESDAFSFASTVDVAIDVTIDEYGTVAESAVVVPEDVQQKAVDADELTNGFADLFGNETVEEETQDQKAA